jgi:hypothetical protein
MDKKLFNSRLFFFCSVFHSPALLFARGLQSNAIGPHRLLLAVRPRRRPKMGRNKYTLNLNKLIEKYKKPPKKI